MFGSNKKEAVPGIGVNQALKIISSVGRSVYSNVSYLKNEKFLNWDNSHYWIAMSGCIPAYSYFVFKEHLKNMKNGIKTVSPAQQQFFKSLEDAVFHLCRISEPEMPGVPISKCLPLAIDRDEVCRSYKIPENTYVRMEMILGIIFKRRFNVYYQDWNDGYFHPGFHGWASHAATRLGADLTGVPTPASMTGCSCIGLGFKAYPLDSLNELLDAYPL